VYRYLLKVSHRLVGGRQSEMAHFHHVISYIKIIDKQYESGNIALN